MRRVSGESYLVFRLLDSAIERVCRAEFPPATTAQDLLSELIRVTDFAQQPSSESILRISDYALLARNHSGQQWRILDPQQQLQAAGLLHGCWLRIRPRLVTAGLATHPEPVEPVCHPEAALPFVLPHLGGSGDHNTTAAAPEKIPKLTVASLLGRGEEATAGPSPQPSAGSPPRISAVNAPRSGFPLYGAVLPLLIAVIVFLVLQNPLVLLFGFLTPALLLAGKLDSRQQARRETQRSAREQWQVALLGTIQQRHLDKLRAISQSVTAVPLPLRELFALQDTARHSSTVQRELLLRGVWQQTLRVSPDDEITGDAPCQIAAVCGVRQLRDTVIYSDSLTHLIDTCQALLAQLLYRYSPEQLQLQYTAHQLPARLRESLSLLPAYTTPQTTVPPTLTVQLQVLAAPDAVAEYPRQRTQMSGGFATHLDSDTAHIPQQLQLVFVLTPNWAIASPEWVPAVELLQLSHPAFRTLCATLSPLRPSRMLATPQAPQWLQLQGLSAQPTIPQVLSNWQESRYVAQLSADFCLDLDSDGPHFLLGGTTGSGKSELLQNLLLSLACQSPPELLRMLLIDYKGGTSFGHISGLPHVEATVTDLAAAGVRRLFTLLRLEMQAREEQLRGAGCANIAEFNRQQSHQIPKLLVVIDEFAALLLEHPSAEQAVIDFAQRGRALGIHLVLATQRPAGTISDKIRANIETRIALRVTNTAESYDIIGCAAAATITKTDLGKCYVRGVTGLRTATVLPVNVALADAAAMRLVFYDAPAAEHTEIGPTAQPTIAVMVTELLKTVAATAITSNLKSTSRTLWVPELPRKLPRAGAYFALCENLETCQQRQLTATDLSPVTLLVGGARSGKTSAIAAIADSWNSRSKITREASVAVSLAPHSSSLKDTVYICAARAKDRFKVLQQLSQACESLRRGNQLLLLLDDAAPLYTALANGDVKLLQHLRAIIKEPQSRTVIAVHQQRQLPTELQQEVHRTWYCDGTSGSLQLPYTLQEMLAPQLQISGRALDASRRELLQFSAVSAQQLRLLDTYCHGPSRPSKPIWAVNAVTGREIAAPQHGLVILSCKSAQTLQLIMTKTTAALAETGLRLRAVRLAAPQQQLSAAIAAAYNAETKDALVIPDLTQLAEQTVTEILQLHAAATARTAASAQNAAVSEQTAGDAAHAQPGAAPKTPLILIGTVHKTQPTWQQRQLFAAADTVLCCGLDSSEQAPAVLLPHLDRWATLNALQGYFLQQENCQIIDFTGIEETAC